MRQVRLGLIGDNIAPSRAPALHRACGEIAGLDLRYDLFVPPALGRSFEAVFDDCLAAGLAGFNVTLPYKERAVARVRIDDPQVARIGAVNTVCATPAGAVGHNTDHSGFIAAYRAAFGSRRPGRVVVLGAGGVGKAVAFGLAALAAEALILVDPDGAKAARLAAALAEAGGGGTEAAVGAVADLARADGVVNCTPLGMVGYPGSPVPEGGFPTGVWAFDAVYTPVDTPFRSQALAAGADFLSGYELFLHQGLDSFRLFTGVAIDDVAALRRRLGEPPPGAGASGRRLLG